MAYAIPFRTFRKGRGEQALVIILTKENMERMREGDPFDFQPRTLASILDLEQPLRNLDIVIAYEEDEAMVHSLADRDDLPGLLAYLERGRRHRQGDVGPPVSVKAKGDKPQ